MPKPTPEPDSTGGESQKKEKKNYLWIISSLFSNFSLCSMQFSFIEFDLIVHW
jgi:hypothetical protein